MWISRNSLLDATIDRVLVPSTGTQAAEEGARFPPALTPRSRLSSESASTRHEATRSHGA
jgi:hypothetical protein